MAPSAAIPPDRISFAAPILSKSPGRRGAGNAGAVPAREGALRASRGFSIAMAQCTGKAFSTQAVSTKIIEGLLALAQAFRCPPPTLMAAAPPPFRPLA